MMHRNIAEPRRADNGLQRLLRSRFRQRLKAGVRQQQHDKSWSKEGNMPDAPATTTTVSLQQKLDGARALCELIRRHRDLTDEARQLAPPVVEALAKLGVFRALVPTSAGGEEWAWPIWLQVVEELSTVDGAVGWNAGVGSAANAIVSGWVSANVGQTVFCRDPIGLVAGAGAPMGVARPVAGE
jgi:hypothetical protein